MNVCWCVCVWIRKKRTWTFVSRNCICENSRCVLSLRLMVRFFCSHLLVCFNVLFSLTQRETNDRMTGKRELSSKIESNPILLLILFQSITDYWSIASAFQPFEEKKIDLFSFEKFTLFGITLWTEFASEQVNFGRNRFTPFSNGNFLSAVERWHGFCFIVFTKGITTSFLNLKQSLLDLKQFFKLGVISLSKEMGEKMSYHFTEHFARHLFLLLNLN